MFERTCLRYAHMFECTCFSLGANVRMYVFFARHIRSNVLFLTSNVRFMTTILQRKPQETICMKCKSLFCWKKEIYIYIYHESVVC